MSLPAQLSREFSGLYSDLGPTPDKDQEQQDATENTHLLTANYVIHTQTSELATKSPTRSRIATLFHEAWMIVKAVFPVVLNHIVEQSIVLASVISAGQLSTTDLAGISLGSLVAQISAFTVINGFTGALDSVLPEAWNSKDPTLVGLWTQRMTLLLAIILIPINLIWANIEPILLLCRQDPEVSHLAKIYLRWLALGLPAFAFNSIMKRYFEAQGLSSITAKIATFVAPINGVINWALVCGPARVNLGFIGAPIAMAFSYNLIALLSLLSALIYARAAWHPICFQSFTGFGLLIRLGMGGMKLPMAIPDPRSLAQPGSSPNSIPTSGSISVPGFSSSSTPDSPPTSAPASRSTQLPV